MDEKILENIGLTRGEIKAYLALLNLGSTTTGPLTDESGISRSKIYGILERLMQKGLVSYITKEKTRYYQAAEPAKITEYLEQKENDIQQQKKQLERFIPELELQQKLGKKINEAQIFKGFKGIMTVHEHIFSKLKKGEGYFYFGIPSYKEEGSQLYWRRMHLKRIKQGIKCRLLFSQDTKKEVLRNRNKYRDCDARYMPIPISTPAWIMGYGDVTVIGLFGDDEIAIEIINEKIAASFNEYFESFWKLTKPFR